MTKSVGLILSACILVLAVCKINCESVQLSDIHVSWINRGSKTDFTVTVPLSGRVRADNVWLGVGLNTAPRMVIYQIFNISPGFILQSSANLYLNFLIIV